MMNYVKMIMIISAIVISTCSFSYQDNVKTKNSQSLKNVLIDKQQEEKKVLHNDFAITLYKPNYIFPFYYTGSPYSAIYVNETPNNEKLKRSEVKYQLSFKIPLWNNILSSQTSLYFGYTQLSYWQLYNKSAFFRSTDYEPEFFTQTKLNLTLGHNWFLNAVKLGAVHQSNGFGNNMERSWNRIYLEASASNRCTLISIRPWIILHDKTYEKYNPDMFKYLGYGEIILAHKFKEQVVSLKIHSLIEQGGRYATAITTYSFPISHHINGFVEIFSGYGQSLIEYNHRSNSVGLGFALNNYI